MSRVLFAGWLVLGLGACQGAGGAMQTDGAPAGPTGRAPDLAVAPQVLSARLRFASSEGGLKAGAMASRFNFARLRDLWVRVEVPSLPKMAVVRLRFLNPQGELIHENALVFSTEPGMTQMNGMQGMEHPMPVGAAKPIEGGYALDGMVPIAGTAFERFPMVGTGTWVVQAEVDGLDTLIMSSLDVTWER